MQYTFPKYVSEAEEKELFDIITINCGAVTLMSKIVLPQMKERKRGAIVNVSSGSELQPLPLMTVYAATKVTIYQSPILLNVNLLYFDFFRPTSKASAKLFGLNIPVTA